MGVIGLDQVITALVAIIAVPLVLLGYIILGEKVIERLSDSIQKWIRPYFWALPAVGFATIFMVYPMLRTVVISFRNNDDTEWIGLTNYQYFFTFPDTLTSLRNSLLWLVFYTTISVALGLIIATGTLNAILGLAGRDPVAWLVNSTTNNAALIFVGIWSITGFCMVIISASLKSISSEVLEAARIDGANEFRIVQLVITPLLWPTITVVGTTMIINALKTFDIVYVMTNGAYDTDVIATQMFRQLQTSHYGRGAAVGVVLFLAIVPLLIVNIRRFQQQEEQR